MHVLIFNIIILQLVYCIMHMRAAIPEFLAKVVPVNNSYNSTYLVSLDGRDENYFYFHLSFRSSEQHKQRVLRREKQPVNCSLDFRQSPDPICCVKIQQICIAAKIEKFQQQDVTIQNVWRCLFHRITPQSLLWSAILSCNSQVGKKCASLFCLHNNNIVR